MARDTYDVKEQYLGTGALSEYTFDFKIESLTQLLVIEYDASGVQTQKVRGDDNIYLSSVDFDPVAGAGTVHLAAALTNNYTLVLLLANDAPTQPSQFKGKADFTLKRLEAALDFIVGSVQRLAYRAARSVQLNDFDDETAFDATLPPGVAANTLNLIPAVKAGGWDDISKWTPVTDLAAAVAAAAAAAASAATSASQAAASAASAATSGVSGAAAAASAAAALVSENNAEQSEDNAGVSETNAAASAVSTGLDKISCDADKVACDADKAACDADVVLTHADVVLTHADVVLTHADVISTAASAAAAAASAASVAAPSISGTRGAPTNVVAATGVVFTGTAYQNLHFLQSSSAGRCDISHNPQIQAGTNVGQRLTTVGCDDTKTVYFQSGNGLVLKNAATELELFADSVIEWFWNGTNWSQM